MTDLRTRIAAALKAQAEFRGIYKIADFDYDFLADAVISELAAILKPQLDAYEEARRYDAGCGEADNAGNDAGDKLAAFLTNWIPDTPPK